MNPFVLSIRAAALRLLALGLTVWLAACAQAPVAPPPQPPVALFHDELIGPAPRAPSAEEIFRLSPAMRDYAAREFNRARIGQDAQIDPRRELINALYHTQRLRLQYDSAITRNAAEAFEARAGNCLSLVIMTAAFAKQLDLPLAYQAVDAQEFYSRSGALTVASGHVNLVLKPHRANTVWKAFRRNDFDNLTIDFLPQDEMRGQRVMTLSEDTIVAMYLNNRAVELLTAQQTAAAYAHARAALVQDPLFVAAANTLGVIYDHAGHLQAAEAAFLHVLAEEPDNVSALSNQSRLLARTGRSEEAQALMQRLARLQPLPPFQAFNEGLAAMAREDYDAAREHFTRELKLQPYQDEVHFWAAQAYWRLGNRRQAERHLALAAEYSPSRSQQDRYAAKLALVRDTARMR